MSDEAPNPKLFPWTIRERSPTEDATQLVNWLEACELEAEKDSARYQGRASAFREAALKARFLREGLK
jgi:hypothetical protein